MSAITKQMAVQIFDSIKELLDEKEITYDEQITDEENYWVTFRYKGEDMSHSMFINILSDRGVLTLSEVLEFEVTEKHMPALLDAINRVNAFLMIGSFYYDGDEHVRFYNPLLFNNSVIAKDTLDELLSRTVSIVEQFDDRFAAVNKGYLSPQAILGED